jgi:predicted alpha-1,2-mannosidase
MPRSNIINTGRLLFSILLIIITIGINSCSKNEKYISKVNPFVGTGGHGHTYPGATAPFGMVQLSPDTRIDDWDGCSGYHYSDSSILGFSHTHLSGTGVADYGDIRIMPTVGDLKLHPGSKTNPEDGYRCRFSHNIEKSSPGYYAVRLDDYDIDVALTVTKRVGFHQYRFPKNKKAHIVLDLKEAIRTEKIHELNIEIIDGRTISGLRRSASWAKDQYCYYAIEFNRNFLGFGIQVDGEKKQELKSAQGKDIQAWFDFDTENDTEVLVKVGLSSVSTEGALKNLKSEIPHWDFQKTLKKTQDEWEQELSKIEVSGDENDERIFYTALYHSLLAPNTWSDVDGQYRGHDLEVHHADHTVYTVFSLWDTFRAEHPLLTLTNPQEANDMIKSMLLMYEKDGLLPVWELAACETNCMIGYHSIPVIYDAYTKNLGDFDPNYALDAMIASANSDQFGLDSYKEYGYVKADEEGESVSKTLEYAYDDWCIAMMAKSLRRMDIYEVFIKRAQNYKNLFDSSTGFMRAKINAGWQKPFEPTEVNFHFTEANSWQYSMFVPQDVNGLIDLHGGDKAFENKLDELFETDKKLSGRHQSDITGLIGQYAHGNEPSHHMAYLYNYTGAPWKAQKLLTQIMNEMYHNRPDGLIGNEDCGQMSAWYVLSSLGFYPVTPGSNDYIIGTPVFPKAIIHLPNGKLLQINTENFSEKNIYVQSILRNGSNYPKSFFTHEDLMKGGTITYRMSAIPNKKFGMENKNRPKSAISDFPICPPPTIATQSQTFKDILLVEMQNHCPDADIFYTINGLEPNTGSNKYIEPFYIDKSTHFKMLAIHPQKGASAIIESHFHKIDGNISLEIRQAYSQLYPAGGDLALIDQIRGNDNFKTGNWQGYHDRDFEVDLTFNKNEKVSKIGIGFIQDQASWIFLPKNVSFYSSSDNKKWKQLGEIENKYDKKVSPLIHDFAIDIYPQKIKYLKIKAENSGPCPDWHLGAGGATWLFADEIWVNQ